MHCGHHLPYHHHRRHGKYPRCHHSDHFSIPRYTGPKYCHRHDWDQYESDPGFFETDCCHQDYDGSDNVPLEGNNYVGTGGTGKPAAAAPETNDGNDKYGDAVVDENSNRMAMPTAPTEPKYDSTASAVSAVKEDINRLTKVLGKLVAKVDEMEMDSKKAEEK